jgi:hypothetical protein
VVSSQILYLDQAFTIWGSGFQKFEPVILYLDLAGTGAPNLGFADADAGGTFTMAIAKPDAISGVASNAAALAAAGALSLRADGFDGSAASAPVVVVAVTPVPPAVPDPPSTGTSLVAGAVAQGGTITIYGAGFVPGELVSLFLLSDTTADGVPLRINLGSDTASGAGTVSVVATPTVDPGVYTVDGLGDKGSNTSAPLVVTAVPK